MAVFLVEILLYLFVDIFLYLTGEIFFWAFTLGRRKPVFRLWGNKKIAAPTPSSSALLGLAFWIIVVVAVIYQ